MSIELERGEVHAVIGTNGAGKSTLINMLSGELPASSGTIELDGHDIGAWSQPKRARAGVGRSYQRTTIFPSFSVLENCRLAAQAALPRAWAVWQSAQRCAHSSWPRAGARRGRPGPRGRAPGRPAQPRRPSASSRSRCAWRPRPRVLLLDEPLAGMGAEETGRMLALLAELKRSHAVLLVEHDMDAVFRIADRITVMVNGAVIASDVPERIRSNPEVQVAYLGEAH